MKTVNLKNLPDQEISLDEAYAQSAAQDKLIAEEFDAALGDGLIEECMFKKPMDADASSS